MNSHDRRMATGHRDRHLETTVTQRNGRPTLVLDGVPVSPCFFALPDVPGGRWSWEEHPRHNIASFASAGFRLFQLDIFFEHVMNRDGELDIDLLRRQIGGVTDIVPDAGVMLRLHLNPPMEWIDDHPGELTLYDGVAWEEECAVGLTRILEADPRNAKRASLASTVWREWATRWLSDVLATLARTPEGRSLCAVQVANGVYGEWHYWGFMRWEPDVSQPMIDRFRDWLVRRYGDDRELQRAWNDSGISFATVEIPDTTARRFDGVIRNPAVEQRVIDYYRCQHELIPELIDHFCATVKRVWPASIATGAFYGYYFSLFNRQAAGGHLEIDRALESKEIDFLCGPQVYYPDDQAPGSPYRSRGLLHSMLLHGKLWLDEYDQEPERTFPFLGGTHDNREAYRRKIARNRSCIRRSTLFALLKGMGLWFYDFGPSGMHINPRGEYNGQLGTAGYWDDPHYLADIGSIKSLIDSRRDVQYESSADVLVVYDPRSHYYLPSTAGHPDPITPRSIDWMSLGLYYSGVVFDAISLRDLDRVDASRYRLVVMANTVLLSDHDIEALDRFEAASVLWIHAPGIIEGDRYIPERVSRIVGIPLTIRRSTLTAACRFVPPEGVDRPDGDVVDTLDGPCDPLFAVDLSAWKGDGTLEVWGRFTDDGAPSLVRHADDDAATWYASVPPQQPLVLSAICDCSGVHRYTEGSDIVSAGLGLIMIHTARGGVRPVRLRSGKRVEIDFGPDPGTCVLDADSGALILAPD